MADAGRNLAAGRPIRVLVVDDETRWRELLLDVLPDMGFAARGARNAEEALDVMATDPHDVLILDIHLPTIDGIELFARVRERWPATQGIVITAYGELSAAQRAIRTRVAEFLTKPCHLADVEAALERARRLSAEAATPAPEPPATVEASRPPTLREAERQTIAEALARNEQNKAAAARELGISRRSLYDRMARGDAATD